MMNEPPLSVYLSGPIPKKSVHNYTEFRDWRALATKVFRDAGWVVHDPIGDKVFFSEQDDDLICARDMMMIQQSDIILVNWVPKVNSIGTPMEAVYGKIYGKTVLWYANNQALADHLSESSWVRQHNDFSEVKVFSEEELMELTHWFAILDPTMHNFIPDDMA